jgi:L-ribulose-5-phosphate 3-epimerase UlaE
MSKLDNLMAKIENKANADAHEAIRLFRKTVEDAAKVLLMSIPYSPDRANFHTCLTALMKPDANAVWPTCIWSKRREEIQNKILQSMDMLSRTLATPEVESVFHSEDE